MRALLAASALLLASAGPAAAQDDEGPRFCPTRPSLAGSSCTNTPGHVTLEVSAIDWTRDDRGATREDTVLAADLLARIGIGPKTELQIGWTGFGHDRKRDAGGAQVVDGTGDVTLGARERLVGREHATFSLGLQPFVTLPAGRQPIGAGTWSAGAIIPAQYDLTKKLAVIVTGEADVAANEAGDGRHLAYSGIGSLRYKLTNAVNLYGEVELERDDDPSGYETHKLLAFSASWRPVKRLQLDALAVAGLNRTSPNIRLVTGGAILF